MKKYTLICALVVSCIIGLPAFSNAATISTDPSIKNVHAGETFSMLINLDSEGATINAASLDVIYDASLLSIQSVGYSNSIFTIWTEEPKYSNSNGLLHFSGGVPSPGWSGSSGAIVNVTFRAKAEGQTKVTLQSGSVLANDGVGTDVLHAAKGLSVNIDKAATVPVVPVIPAVPTATTATTTSIAAPSPEVTSVPQSQIIPILGNIPDSLNEGSTLSFSGSATAGGQVQVYIQKGKGTPEIIQLDTDTVGGFVVRYGTPVRSGYYKIWAKSILPNGMMSASSEVSYVEVVSTGSFSILGGIIVSYKSAVICLAWFSIILLILLIALLMSHLTIHKQKSREIADAKATLHKGFDTLKTGLNSYIRYLTKSTSIAGAKKKEDETKEDLQKDLISIERKIEKGINDIKDM